MRGPSSKQWRKLDRFRKEGKTGLFRQEGLEKGKISRFLHVGGSTDFFFLQAGSIKIWMNIASYFQIKAKWELKLRIHSSNLSWWTMCCNNCNKISVFPSVKSTTGQVKKTSFVYSYNTTVKGCRGAIVMWTVSWTLLCALGLNAVTGNLTLTTRLNPELWDWICSCPGKIRC